MINSPNDWLMRAGARIEDTQIVFPLTFLLVPMGLASEAILEFKKAERLNDKIKHGLVVVTMVRIAETAYFRTIAKMLMGHHDWNGSIICEHCIRGQLWPNKMKEYRQNVNKRIIHKMEEGHLPVNDDDLQYVEKYYDEMFKHPLVDPISWPGVNNLVLCEQHKKNSKKSKPKTN